MPQNSGDILSGHVNNMIKQLMDRQHQEQQQKQFQSEMAQKLAFHNDSMGLQRAAAARAAQAAADAHRKMDPMYEINQYKALEDWVRGQQGGQPQQPQQPMPTQEMGEGMGMFSPEGMQEAQQQPVQPPMPPTGGLDMELLKAHPMLRGFAKKHLGFDPMATVAQTPQEKQDMAIETFKRKQDIRTGNDGNTAPLTNTIKTQMQGIIAGVPKVKVKIDALKDAPSPTQLIGYKPDQKAKHSSLVRETAETYAKAKGWPNTNESINTAIKILDRHTFESDAAYRKRLDELKISLDNDYNDAKNTLSPGSVTAMSSGENNDPLGLGL